MISRYVCAFSYCRDEPNIRTISIHWQFRWFLIYHYDVKFIRLWCSMYYYDIKCTIKCDVKSCWIALQWGGHGHVSIIIDRISRVVDSFEFDATQHAFWDCNWNCNLSGGGKRNGSMKSWIAQTRWKQCWPLTYFCRVPTSSRTCCLGTSIVPPREIQAPRRRECRSYVASYCPQFCAQTNIRVTPVAYRRRAPRFVHLY